MQFVDLLMCSPVNLPWIYWNLVEPQDSDIYSVAFDKIEHERCQLGTMPGTRITLLCWV